MIARFSIITNTAWYLVGTAVTFSSFLKSGMMDGMPPAIDDLQSISLLPDF